MLENFDYYLLTFCLALPAFLGNMSPVVIAKLGWLKKFNLPIDRNKTIFGKRIFGDHKTIRGFLVGTLAGLLIGLVQYLAKDWILLSKELINLGQFLAFGALGALGALVGDTLESFAKRQIGIKSGRPFLPFDQIDYIIGFLVLTSFFVNWEIQQIIFLLICGLVLNPLSNIIGYALRIKKTYW